MQVARKMFEKGAYVFGFVSRGAYNHIDIFVWHRTFLGFLWKYGRKEHYYMCNSLPFRLASAGHIFTKVVRVVITYLRSKCHNVLTFLDDGLGGSKSYEKALISSKSVHQTLLELGFLLSDEKCQWVPSLIKSYEKALISSKSVHQTLLELGFLLSDEKCQWVPSLIITWLGYFLNMRKGKFLHC